jgi:hypothetical protein
MQPKTPSDLLSKLHRARRRPIFSHFPVSFRLSRPSIAQRSVSITCTDATQRPACQKFRLPIFHIAGAGTEAENRDFLRVRVGGMRLSAKRGYFLLIVVNIQTPLPSLVGQFSTGVTAHFHPVDPAARQNGLVGRYFPSRVITAREPPSGSSTFLISSLKLIALMMPSPNFS